MTLKLYKTRPNFGSGVKRVVLLALAILMLATPVAASALSAGGLKVTVMTRNIYLGADLSPALNATTIDGAIDGSGVIWNEPLSTNFPERAVPLAREIKASGADLVGLQEVALWRQQIPSDLGAPPTGVGAPATQVKFDFLALLHGELDAIGANYEVVHVQQEFDAELPADLDQNNATGSPPFGAEPRRAVDHARRDPPPAGQQGAAGPGDRYGRELRDQVHPTDRWSNPASGQPLEFRRSNHQRRS